MKIPLYHIDAFAGEVFTGNPAAVCPLPEWPDDGLLQQIAMENNLPETAFFVPEKESYRIRWFSPEKEVDLCGHATLAAAWVLFRYFEHSAGEISFRSRSGPLAVRREEELIVLDFPAQPPEPCGVPPELAGGLGRDPVETLRAGDVIAVFSSEEEVAGLTPDPAALARVEARAVVVTAPGEVTDFVSRCFAPRLGIVEDQVTGSAHCELVPYWSKVLGKKDLTARQLSPRGGELHCTDKGDRVFIAGRAVPYLEGMITIGEQGGISP